MKNIIFMVVIIVVIVLVLYLQNGKKTSSDTEDINNSLKVWSDENQIYIKHSSKDAEFIKWESLIGVAIEINDQGPLTEDIHWVLATDEKIYAYPDSADGVSELLEKLQTLPTFNNERLIEAMSRIENQTFILWDKEGRHLK